MESLGIYAFWNPILCASRKRLSMEGIRFNSPVNPTSPMKIDCGGRGRSNAEDAMDTMTARLAEGCDNFNPPVDFSTTFLSYNGSRPLCSKIETNVLSWSLRIHSAIREDVYKRQVSRLIGSPPGYVGYDEGGQLSERVRQHPYSVILFDEIEKAHPDIFNVFLQILDDGRITDAQGRTIDFKNTVIIMTSNIGARSIVAPSRLGFPLETTEKARYEDMRRQVMEEVKRLFRPEFLNRVDEILVFHALNREHIEQIVEILFAQMAERMEKAHTEHTDGGAGTNRSHQVSNRKRDVYKRQTEMMRTGTPVCCSMNST